jgi:SAM-dependent methyltransferase
LEHIERLREGLKRDEDILKAVDQSPRTRRPIPLACPECRGRLNEGAEWLDCENCGRRFSYEGDFPDLVVGDRFDDPTDEAQMFYEEQSNEDLARNYLLPMFRELWRDRRQAPLLLSVGCGTGADVDVLCDEGFDCMGIDCGNRVAVWPRRRNPDRLLLANGQHLPFEDDTFDGIFCGCVFPHVGVVGDSYQVTESYQEDRLRLAAEMSRVLKPQGKILVSSPNRAFPMDIFHRCKQGSYLPRPYWPGDPFLLSAGDYERLFLANGCARVTLQPVRGYWGFLRSKRSTKGYLLGLPVRMLFWLVSCERLRFLRSSALSPWIVVLVEKGARA